MFLDYISICFAVNLFTNSSDNLNCCYPFFFHLILVGNFVDYTLVNCFSSTIDHDVSRRIVKT
jgi:hypothetical protein